MNQSGDEAVVENIEENIGLLQNYLKQLPEKALDLGLRVLFALIFLFLGIQVIKIIRKIVRRSCQKANADQGVVQFLDSFMKMVLYVLLAFMIASSFGLDAASVVAVVGSAGVAIGLALQGSLSNLAGGVLILLLKPFRIGDYIIEDSKNHEGTVTEIQLFFTKLTTADGKIVVLPNGTLANTSLTNVTAAADRRLDVFVGISYEADLKKAKECMLEVLKAEESTLKDMEILSFVESLGSSEVVIGGRCHVKNEDYFQAKWRITENVKLAMDENGISIPYPQMDVHLREGGAV